MSHISSWLWMQMSGLDYYLKNNLCFEYFSSSGRHSAGIFPTLGCCCVLLAGIASAAAASCPLADQPSPANRKAKVTASTTTPPSLRANQWVYLISNMVCLCLTLSMSYALNYELLILDLCVCDICVLSQAHFSDTEEDCSSRVPVSRESSSDVKQVRHASQRLKVKVHSTEEFERAATHNPTAQVICHLSQITVSIKSWRTCTLLL